MSHRRQRTISRAVSVQGRGLFGGADVTLELLPAPEFHGVAFQRIDLADRVRIPARVAYVARQPRRTMLSRLGATVEVVEHVLAALAGLQVDNCLVRLDAPECPGVDGSARPFVDALLEAEIVEQTALTPRLVIDREFVVSHDDGREAIAARPSDSSQLRISYELDYPGGVIAPQTYSLTVTPETFVDEIAFARTFVLESEVKALRAQGLGLRATAQDLLVFDGSGAPIDNALRAEDECVRHKILDCIGDFALAGTELLGEFHARQSGHHQNHEIIRNMTNECSVSRGRAA